MLPLASQSVASYILYWSIFITRNPFSEGFIPFLIIILDDTQSGVISYDYNSVLQVILTLSVW